MDKVKLGDVVDILDSLRIPVSSKERATREKIFPYYGAQGIVDYIDDYLFDGNFILVAEDGNNLKALNEPIVTWATGQFWVNNHAHILGDNGCSDIRFVYYYLMASDLRGLITGSAQPKLNQENLASFVMELPPISEQRASSALLGNIDDKITNNQKLIKELEDIARLIYDYWFTQFDFPDENGKPYRSSGGKMVWNNQLKREIPEGWEVGTLAEILTLKKDTCLPQSGSLYEHYSIPSFDLNKMPEFSDGSTIDSGKYVIHTGDLLYSKLNPKFKRLWRPARIESLNAICSTEFLVLHPVDNHFSAFCYSVLDSNDFYGYMVTNAISSTGSRSRVSPDVAMNYTLPIAPSKVEQSYSDITQPFMEKIDAMTLENSRLASLRDWLLPMLINGQVVIDE